MSVGFPSDDHERSLSPLPLSGRLGCTVDEATEISTVGRTKLYEDMNAGKLVYRKRGKRRIVLIHGPGGLIEYVTGEAA